MGTLRATWIYYVRRMFPCSTFSDCQRKTLCRTCTLTIRVEMVEIREIASKTRTRRDTELRCPTMSVYRFNVHIRSNGASEEDRFWDIPCSSRQVLRGSIYQGVNIECNGYDPKFGLFHVLEVWLRGLTTRGTSSTKRKSFHPDRNDRPLRNNRWTYIKDTYSSNR